MGMLDDLPSPFMVNEIKVWPVHSRAGFSHFIAYEGKPYYFTTKGAAILFAKEKQAMDDSEERD
jgi:YHS domain-containing protein